MDKEQEQKPDSNDRSATDEIEIEKSENQTDIKSDVKIEEDGTEEKKNPEDKINELEDKLARMLA